MKEDKYFKVKIILLALFNFSVWFVFTGFIVEDFNPINWDYRLNILVFIETILSLSVGIAMFSLNNFIMDNHDKS